MPHTHQPDPTSPIPYTPICPTCGKEMRLVLVRPHDRFKNLDDCTFRCECGEEAGYFLARKD